MRLKVSSNGKRTLLAGGIFLACFSTIVLYLGATHIKTVLIYPTPPSTYGITEIDLEEVACGIANGGSSGCSSYKAVIKSDCSFQYKGDLDTSRLGTYQGRVSDYDFLALCRFIKESGYMDLKNSYDIPVYDMATTKTSVVMNGKRKSVSNYGDAAPHDVWALEQLIDKLLIEAKWHKVKSSASTQPRKSH